MTTNRSSEELEMRAMIETWGRQRYPGARVVHELVTGGCRIDMAFIQRDHVAGVEIKSSKDVLDRLDKQIETYHRMLPEVWVCAAPRWDDHEIPYRTGRLWIADGKAQSWRQEKGWPRQQPAIVDRTMTVPMLHLLWQAELFSLCAHSRVSASRRDRMSLLTAALARKLTGDEIVAGVCRELRARAAFPERPASDGPIREVAA
jgi:hypothetical protein